MIVILTRPVNVQLISQMRIQKKIGNTKSMTNTCIIWYQSQMQELKIYIFAYLPTKHLFLLRQLDRSESLYHLRSMAEEILTKGFSIYVLNCVLQELTKIYGKPVNTFRKM